MSRCIDADAFYKDICDSLNEMTRIGIAVDGEWLWEKLNDSLENAPTIEPQRTGRWIIKPHIYNVAYCSECDFELHINDTPYCPNCGARMEGE